MLISWTTPLINSCKIDAIKVQTIVEGFIRGKKHTSIFCLTETIVDSHDFEPRGIKMFSRHRTKKDKKGGGLAIGYDKDADIKLEQMNIKNTDILALEGTIFNTKLELFYATLTVPNLSQVKIMIEIGNCRKKWKNCWR